MKNRFLRIAAIVFVLCLGFALCAACGGNPAQTQESGEAQSLFVYAGAGLKKPMDEIAQIYKEKNSVTVEYSYAGSAQLISQIELSQKGDVFIVGSEQVYKKAQEKNMCGDYKTVAYHTPAIAVPKGNPAGITTLADLAKTGVKVVLGDETSNAIGQTAQKIIEKNHLEAINDNVISKAATVNEIVVQLTSGNGEAAIVTKDSVFGNKDLEVIEISPEENIDQIIPVGTVTYSENPEAAQAFVDFVASPEGKAIFEKYGFAPVE